MDTDLDGMSPDALIAEVKRLRAAIREHRDSSGHDLCWHHPQLWGLLPEPMPAEVAVPPWPKFLRGCLKYREALERELPNAPCTTPSIPIANRAAAARVFPVYVESHSQKRGLTPLWGKVRADAFS